MVERQSLRAKYTKLGWVFFPLLVLLASCGNIMETRMDHVTLEKGQYVATLRNASMDAQTLVAILSKKKVEVVLLVETVPEFKERRGWLLEIKLSGTGVAVGADNKSAELLLVAPPELPRADAFFYHITVHSAKLEGSDSSGSFSVELRDGTAAIENGISDQYEELGKVVASSSFDRKNLATREMLVARAKKNFPRFQSEETGSILSVVGRVISIDRDTDEKMGVRVDSGFVLRTIPSVADELSVGDRVRAVGHLAYIANDFELDLPYLQVDDSVVWKQ